MIYPKSKPFSTACSCLCILRFAPWARFGAEVTVRGDMKLKLVFSISSHFYEITLIMHFFIIYFV